MDWENFIIKALHEVHGIVPEQIVIGAAAESELIASVEAELGFSFPDEFRSLYASCNGVGVKSNRIEGVRYLVQPIEAVCKFTKIQRAGFVGTHPDAAHRYFPFVDWGNGDSCGYFVKRGTSEVEGIACFDHEEYSYSEAQPTTEFLSLSFRSIADLFELKGL